MNDLESMKTVYKGPITITGGSESGHDSSGHGRYMLDFSRNSDLNSYVLDNQIATRPGNLGQVYDVRMPNGDVVTFMDETVNGGGSSNWARHWHANFPPQ
jgi:hypothetical protein